MWNSVDGRRLLVFLPEGDMSLEKANQYARKDSKINRKLKFITGNMQIDMSYTWDICSPASEGGRKQYMRNVNNKCWRIEGLT